MATKRKRVRKSNADASAKGAAKAGAPARVAPRKRADASLRPKAGTGGKPRGADAGEPTEAGAAEAAAPKARARKRRARRGAGERPRKRRWPLVAVGSVLLVILLAAGGLAWDRWLRYDDAADFQGAWQAHGTTGVVVIDGGTIKLTEDVSWAYSLDTGAKTISYTFGNMKGSGRYRFSPDRSQLVITDGAGYSWVSTLTDDVAWRFDQLVRAIQGQPQQGPPSGDGYTVLDRLSHDAAAAPHEGEPAGTGPAPDPGAGSAPDPDPGSEPVPEPASEPAFAPAPEPEAGPGAGAGSDPDAGGGAGGAEASGAPSGLFDVSDVPA